MLLFVIATSAGPSGRTDAQDNVSKIVPATPSPSIVAQGAELKLVVGDCKFTEGPASDSKGNVYFTDQPNDRIVRIGIDGTLGDFLKPAGRSNGMFFAPDGKLIACADGNTEMWEIDTQTGSHRVLFSTYKNSRFNGPNDVWVHPSGTLYFTDPFYKRPWWQHADQPQPTRAIYAADRDGSNVRLLDDQFKTPNGIVGDANRKLLFVADIGDSKTYAYTIADGGTLENRKLFCNEGSDGMTLDRDGNLYLTGKAGVTVYDSSGQKREIIAVPRGWTANVCFGGKDHNQLFITASDAVFTIKTNMQGL
ncbi:MAG TPA: gluconolactonase [Planctomycetaceae bacterium]|nr:gluconolactonase [Planctomycetaceae bacterium]